MSAKPEPYFLGCGARPGHYVFDHLGNQRRRPEWMLYCDGRLAPLDTEEQGVATLSYLHGYTAISFWDRSVDTRPASNAIFFIPRYHDFETALAWARAAFPWVFARLAYPILPHHTVPSPSGGAAS